MLKRTLTLLTSALLLGGCGNDSAPISQHGKVSVTQGTAQRAEPAAATVAAQSAKPETTSDDGIMEIDWDMLIPEEWRPDPVLVEMYNNGEIEGNDPRLLEMEDMLSSPVQPANPELDGKRIKLPGFVVPLEGDGKKVSEFLLVPYQGACIHVPPPPTNQTIYVKTGPEGSTVRRLFDTVWVIGKLVIENVESDVADAGYTIYAESVVPYE